MVALHATRYSPMLICHAQTIQANMQKTHHIKGSNMLAWFGEVGVYLSEVRGSVTCSGTYGITKRMLTRKPTRA